jgi:hypothetical protein
MFRVLTPAQLYSLASELDIFSDGPPPLPELVAEGLYPPLPVCADTLVWGFTLLRSAKSMGLTQLNCLLLSPRPPAERLGLALKLENRPGGYSWPEKQKMLAYLAAADDSPASAFPPLSQLLEELSTLIEGRRDPQLASRIASFSALPPLIQQLVAEGRIDLKCATRVQELPPKVFQRLCSASLSFSQRRQFLNELYEISRRNGLSQRRIEKIAEGALAQREPQEAIHRLRFPALSELEKRFSNLEQQLLKGSGVRLQPPPYYEGDSYTVTFAFNSDRSLARKLTALRVLQGRLDALLELLH